MKIIILTNFNNIDFADDGSNGGHDEYNPDTTAAPHNVSVKTWLSLALLFHSSTHRVYFYNINGG
jgi:hypothetical protein